MAVSQAEQQQMLGSEETGLQEHNNDNCLYCAGLSVLGVNTENNNPGGILVLLERTSLTHTRYQFIVTTYDFSVAIMSHWVLYFA